MGVKSSKPEAAHAHATVVATPKAVIGAEEGVADESKAESVPKTGACALWCRELRLPETGDHFVFSLGFRFMRPYLTFGCVCVCAGLS